MNIDARDAKVLKYFKNQGDVFLSDITFESADLSNLVNNGLLKTKDVSVPQGEGMFPSTKTAYFITQRGLYALEQYYKNVLFSHLVHTLTILIGIAGVVIGIIQLLR